MPGFLVEEGSGMEKLVIVAISLNLLTESLLDGYLSDNAHTPLNRFVVYMLNKQVCSRHGDKTNRWSLGLCLSVGDLKRRRCDLQSPSCSHLLIAARQVARRNVFKSTVAQTKMGHVSKTTPLLGVIYHPYGKA